MNVRPCPPKLAGRACLTVSIPDFGAWRNWHTRVPQEHVAVRPCGFESRRPDQIGTHEEGNQVRLVLVVRKCRRMWLRGARPAVVHGL